MTDSVSNRLSSRRPHRPRSRRKPRRFLLAISVLVVWSAASATPAGAETGIAEPRLLLIDTDPAMGYLFRDIDDGLMILAALGSSEVSVVGITTTFGNVSGERTAAKAAEILRMAGRMDIPVVPGASEAGIDSGQNAASRFIASTIRANPGQVTILATGPLTNVASAFRADPELVGLVQEVVVVGGMVEFDGVPLKGAPRDMNFGDDPGAAEYLIGIPVPLTMVHIALCLEFMTDSGQLSRLVDHQGPLADYTRRQTRSWRLLNGGRIVPWDVVGLSYVVHPELYTTEITGVRLSVTGEANATVIVRPDQNLEREIRLPMQILDEPAFWEWFGNAVSRVLSG